MFEHLAIPSVVNEFFKPLESWVNSTRHIGTRGVPRRAGNWQVAAGSRMDVWETAMSKDN